MDHIPKLSKEDLARVDEKTTQDRAKDEITKVCEDLCNLLLKKNHAYGDSAINPRYIFTNKAVSPVELLNIRIDDKLSRIANGSTDEDAEWDLMGYLVLKRVAIRLETKAKAQ